MTTMSLFDMAPHPRYRRSDPQTSVDAARAVGSGAEEAVLRAFHRVGYRKQRWLRDGFTDDELCTWLPHMYAPTVKSARSRLSGRGLLVDSGTRRLSDRNRSMIVWTLA